MDKELRPKHVCVPVAWLSAQRWATSVFGPDVETDWPLPVGETTAPATVVRPFLSGGAQELPLRWAPFSGDVRAALVLQVEINGTLLEMFAPAKAEARGGRNTGFLFSARSDAGFALEALTFFRHDFNLRWQELRWRVTGDPTDHRVTALLETVRRWWRPFVGQRVGQGRPRGSGTFSSEAEFRAIVDPIVRTIKRQGRRPTLEAVGMELEDREYITARASDGNGLGMAKDPGRQVQRWVRRLTGGTWDEYLNTIE
jgi:hypothetical protein